MRGFAGFVGGCLLAASAVSVVAETMYVTDKLYLGLYRSSDGSGEQFQVIPSGTELEILERDGRYGRVKTVDGTEGWVKLHFLVSTPPAIVQIRTLEAENRQVEELRAESDANQQALLETRAELAMLNSKLKQAEQTEAELREAVSNGQAEPAAVHREAPVAQKQPTDDSELAVLRSQNRILQQRLDVVRQAVAGDQPFSSLGMTAATDWPRGLGEWLIGVALSAAALLGLGFWIGVKWLELRVRKRYGGRRIW